MKIKKDIESCKACVYRQMLFGDLDDFEYKLINDVRTEKLYKRGEMIKHEGEKVDSFLYLRKGMVKLFKTDKREKEQILSINKPGDFVNLLTIFTKTNYKYSIEAIEDTLVCDVDLEVLEHIISANSKFAMRVLNRMSNISEEIIENRFEQGQKQLKGRIATILLYFADDVYHKKIFDLPITRREIGELIAMTTENTIRTFSEFKRDGLIDIQNKTITLIDYNRLKSIAKSG
jgi:CRP/FNR family transcriptional regulator